MRTTNGGWRRKRGQAANRLASRWPARSLQAFSGRDPAVGSSLWKRPGAKAAPQSSSGSDPQLARLEAVLFLASEPLPSRRLAQLAGLEDGTQARTFVRRLNSKYDRHGFAFRVEEVAQGFQLLTRPQFGPWLRRLRQTPQLVRLSSPAMETLAVVAHRQPVLRAEIEAIRGVQSGEMLKQLMELDLVRIVGRSPELGRPFQYGTTKKFLQVFGLKNLDELPRADLLKRDVQQPPTWEGEPDTSETRHSTQEESDVKVELWDESSQDEVESQVALATAPLSDSPRAAADEDDDFEEDEEYEDEGDEEDEEYDDEEEEDEDEDFEDEDWEEVDDEDEDWDEEDDDDWDEEDDDDDWDEDDEE